jgi:serpin B
MKFPAIFLTVLGLLISTACTRDLATEPGQVHVRDLSQIEKQITKASDDFGLKLLQKIAAEEKDNNIFISPLSVSMALGMTMNGANGITENAMQKTLGFDGMSSDEINKAYQSLIKLLTSIDPLVQFEIANSIWSRKGFPVEADFINTNKNYFDAMVQSLDFNTDAVNTINNWVDDKTHGKIDKIVEKIPAEAMMYLINAIYFKGTWTYEFNKSDTQDGSFFITSDSETTVPFMSQTNDNIPYQQNDLFQAVDLPYGNKQFRMTVILPNYKKDIDEVIDNLNAANWNTWTTAFVAQKGTLHMPKFTMEYKKSLSNILQAMGMQVAFGPGADFTGINKNGNLFISEVLHKTFVDVYEEGTEAAAVTSVEISLTSVGGPSGFFMRVDRPFLFAIREKSSGTILFIGKINNPA